MAERKCAGEACAELQVSQARQEADRRRIESLEHSVYGNNGDRGIKEMVNVIWTILEGQKEGRAVKVAIVLATLGAIASLFAGFASLFGPVVK